MPQSTWRKSAAVVAPYAWATLAVALALLARILLNPLIGENRPFLTFLPAVALATWVGNRTSGIFAIVLSYLVANYFFIPPVGEFNFDHTSSSDWGNLLVFIVLSLLIVEPIVATRRAQSLAEASAREVARLLAEAKEEARKKDQFLATLAHELRNPLAAIGYGLSYWPQIMHNPTEMEQVREIMNRQARIISRLVDDMMNVVRFDRGVLRLQKAPLDIVALIGEAIESVRYNIDAHSHQLQVNLPSEPLLVDGDAVRLNQVFLNLLDNAIKYTCRNGTISISARRQENNAVVRVRDNGPGINRSVLPRVFEMFAQARPRSIERPVGLVSVCSWSNNWSTCTVAPSKPAARGKGRGVSSSSPYPRYRCKRRRASCQSPPFADRLVCHRLLVVDDVKDAADTLAKAFCSIGQDATALYDGQSAIEWICAHQPDVVFLDVAMPGLSGYEVVQRLRLRPELRSTVWVALTALGRREDERRAVEAGFDFHLTKPAEIEELENVLRRIPQPRPGTAEAVVR